MGLHDPPALRVVPPLPIAYYKLTAMSYLADETRYKHSGLLEVVDD